MSTCITKTDFQFPGQTNVYHGKVRDMYTINDTVLVAVATDRISAFDVILPEPIPYKGQVLNQTAAYFLQATKDICPNWLLDCPDPNVSVGLKCEPFKIEMVIRGCLVGHAWREYSAGKRELCGESMPENLLEYDAFPEPLITPSTKADEGHDEDISHAEIIQNQLATQEEFDELCRLTRALFQRGQAMAAKQGLYLADTKYEFGKKDGKIYLIDEVHTPDSSRYFELESYQAFVADRNNPQPRHISKEFVRSWLIENGFQGKSDQTVPKMDKNFVTSVSEKYIELYELVTGQKFEPADTTNIEDRIIRNVEESVQNIV